MGLALDAGLGRLTPLMERGDLLLQPLLGREARRYGETVRVVDRVTSVLTGTVPPHRPEFAPDLRRGFEAGRALRGALREIQAAPRLALRRLVRGAGRTIAQRVVQVMDALR